jgi:hypothetical protein
MGNIDTIDSAYLTPLFDDLSSVHTSAPADPCVGVEQVLAPL